MGLFLYPYLIGKPCGSCVVTHYLRSIKGIFAHVYFAYPQLGDYMKEIKAFKDALHKASNDASHYMTAQLRSEAAASGWPKEVTRSMRIVHKDGSFDVHTTKKHKNAVMDLEYGTPESQPTAAIRRYGNRTHQAEEYLVKRMSKIMGEI